jgi:hypothetical protein
MADTNHHHHHPTTTDDDEIRRRNEMNMFAMMAGGADESYNSNSIAIQRDTLNESKIKELNNAAALFETSDNHNHNNDVRVETAIPPAGGQPATAPMMSHQQHHHHNNNNTEGIPNNNVSESPPMCCERIVLPRPLFFSSHVPPEWLAHRHLPNVQNAIDFFSMRTVSTYQPIFTNREERVNEYRQRHGGGGHPKPKLISRVSTAPPRLSPPSTLKRPIVFDTSGFPDLIPEDEALLAREQSIRSIGVPEDGTTHVPPRPTAITREISDQEKFSQWALMGSNPDMVVGGNSISGDMSLRFSSGTFQRRFVDGGGSDDDNSMIEDEQKTKVGASDNLNKALALLSADGTNEPAPTTDLEQPTIFVSQVDGGKKRPLTNFELTQGCTPLFALDDPPLPEESDLGIHETREEQQKSGAQKRSHELIDKFVPPNVFGSVACPNVATSPDDCRHVRNPKTVPRCRSPDKPPKSRSSRERRSATPKTNVRYGWWNKPWGEENAIGDSPEESNDKDDGDTSFQLPPIHHGATASSHMIHSPLEPTPEQLQRDNLPLSRMHAATSMIQTLPFLSDRPPSLRHLQIDTQAVAFPQIKEEIEPLFCSIAIYNVETVAGTSSKTPLPDLQRCGRVTEALYFDYHAHESVETRCHKALWPYGGEHVGTRCGIFPIPSNLNVANLYAVLIVRKVIGSAGDDLDPYLQPGKTWTDVERLKVSAERASEKNGQILIPFAFGVAPLMQVFGMSDPVTASSRAVQIPLFHYSSSERQIINHIMYMLFPRYVLIIL